jgi:hypothetical protein
MYQFVYPLWGIEVILIEIYFYISIDMNVLRTSEHSPLGMCIP